MDQSEIKHFDMPLQSRLMPVAKVDKEARTVEVQWTAGARVRRYDWQYQRYYLEELSMEPANVRMGRLESGSAPVLNSHDMGWRDGILAQIGVVERASLSPATATLRFSKRDDVTPIFSDVLDGIIRNVSFGYVINRFEMLPPQTPDGDWIYRAVDWEPYEISLVPVPADPNAGVRSADGKPVNGVRTFPCDFIPPAAAAAGSSTTRKENHMAEGQGQGSTPAAATPAGSNAVDPAVLQQQATETERARVLEIQSRVATAGLPPAFGEAIVKAGDSIDAACRKIVDELAKTRAAAPIAGSRIEVVEDERVKLREAVSAAISHRATPGSTLPNNGAGDFRYKSLLRIAEEVLVREGVAGVRNMSPMQISSRALQSVSDFPAILADAINKRLRNQYMENMPSYTRWARRAPNAPDFKTINVIKLSNSPDLLKILEGGEFKTGSMTDGKETYNVFTYGRKIGISRQSIINDDMNAFNRIPIALANAARRLENRTVYGVLTNGLTATLSDTGALFNNTVVTTAGGHANYATGAGSALALTSLTTSRAAMRVQKGDQQEELNLAPAFLIAPAALEQTAYQLTSNLYVPTKPADVNEFRAGGRTAVEPIIEAVLDATSTTAWYLAADSAQVDTVEYCYLDGFEGLFIDNQIGFDIDGMEVKARLDFAAAPIDFRGLYQNKGS